MGGSPHGPPLAISGGMLKVRLSSMRGAFLPSLPRAYGNLS